MDESGQDKQGYQLVIIGAGTAGITAAQEALDLGAKRIALVEKESRLGGDCANYSCVPTKTLLTAAKLLKIRQQMSEYGIKASLQFEMEQLAQKVNRVVGDDDYDIRKDKRLTLIQGNARFVSPQELDVNGVSVLGGKFIIATGAEPVVPDIEGLKDSGYLAFKQASRLKQLPKSMILLGGGPVGVEFAQAFQMLGCPITLLERGDTLMSREEPEISGALQHKLQQDGVTIHTGCEAIKVEKHAAGKKVIAQCDGQQKTFEAEEILLCLGMKPDLMPLDLAKAGVAFNHTEITVNQELQTSCPHIWAIGDAVGPYRFTHVADYQAVVAAQNAVIKAGRAVDYYPVPWAIYTEPSVAHVGYTEEEARQVYPNIQVLTAEVKQVSRYRIESQEEGFIKLIVDVDGQKLVGGHIIATHAEEMAHMLLLAIREKTPLNRLKELIFIYPARAQLIQKALEQ